MPTITTPFLFCSIDPTREAHNIPNSTPNSKSHGSSFSPTLHSRQNQNSSLRHLISPQQSKSSFARIQYNWLRYYHCKNAKKPLPSTQNLVSSEDCITTLTANADTVLRDFERRKLNRSNNTRANPPIPGKAVIGDLLRSQQRLLIPIAIDDQCSNIHYTMAKCLHQSHHVNNLRSTDQMPRQCMKEQRATSIPAQCEILFEADNNWKQIQKTQSITRRFFGHSWLQHHLSQQSNKKVLVSHTHTTPSS